MKIKYVLIAFISLIIADTLNSKLNTNHMLSSTIADILGILLAVCTILLIYLVIRRIITKMKGRERT